MIIGKPWVCTLLFVFLFGSSLNSWAGGFGGFGGMIKNNLKNSAKKRARRTKEKARKRVIGAKKETISNLTGGIYDGSSNLKSSGSSDFKENLKDQVKKQVKSQAKAMTPLANIDSKEEARSHLSSSLRKRLSAIRSRVSEKAETESGVSDLPGSSGSSPLPGDGDAIRNRLKKRIQEQKGRVTNLSLSNSRLEDFYSIDGISKEDASKIVDYRAQNASMSKKELIDLLGYKKYIVLRARLSEDSFEE